MRGQYLTPVQIVMVTIVFGFGLWFFGRASARNARPAPVPVATLEQDSCAAQLEAIGRRLIERADANGALPASFEAIADDADFKADRFVCPASGFKPGNLNACYAYIPGQRRTGPEFNVLVYEKQSNHPEGMANVLFANGRVRKIAPYGEVMRLVSETRERLRRAATQADR